MDKQTEAKPDMETKAKEEHTETNPSQEQCDQSKQQKGGKKSKSMSNNEGQSEQQNEDQGQKSDFIQNQKDSQQGQDDDLELLNPNEKIEEGEAFMLPQQRQIDHKHPKYHFCRFISRHYRLIEDKKDRKNHFVRMQPVFVRFLHVLKLHSLPLITIDTFRKYFKKFFKRRGIKYQETTNRVDMKVVIGIDRRYNSKFQF